MHGLILFAHGARDPRWARPFEAVAERVRQARPGLHVALAYLELMEPSLETAGAALADAGCRHVDVLPLFLGAGGHVRKDLPAKIDQLRQTHPGTEWRLHTAAGESEPLIAALATWALDIAAQPQQP